MKTINKDILIFNSLESAIKKFKSTTKGCQLLHSKTYKSYFIDFSKTALKAWPNHYTLINEK